MSDQQRIQYILQLDDIKLLADIVADLDAFKGYAISTEHKRLARNVERGHDILTRALGRDVHLVYGRPDEPEAA